MLNHCVTHKVAATAMNWLLRAVSGCLLATSLLARQGIVETQDGHVYHGHIRLDSNCVVIANAAKDLLVSVDITNLVGLAIEEGAAPPQRLSAMAEGALPALWQSEDIGSVALTGS